MSTKTEEPGEAGLHTSDVEKTTISTGTGSAVKSAPVVTDEAATVTPEMLAAATAEADALERTLRAATLAKAAAHIKDVADGVVPFEPTKGNVPIRISDYGYSVATHLGGALGKNRKEVITLALCHYARALTSPQVTTLNDLALLTKGLQFVVQDMTMEVAEFNSLSVKIANQEATAGSTSA